MISRSFDKLPPDAEFVVSRAFRHSGEDFAPGQPFARALASRRTLRMYYEHRMISEVEGTELVSRRTPQDHPVFSPVVSMTFDGDARPLGEDRALVVPDDDSDDLRYVEPEPDDEPELDLAPPEPAPEPEGEITAEHRGGGRYYHVRRGERISDQHWPSMEEAEAAIPRP